MGAVIHNTGAWTTAALMATQIINDLKNNGFVVKYTNIGAVGDAVSTGTIVTLEAGADVDPLYATQPWRIQVDGTGTGIVNIYVGTAVCLPDGAVKTAAATLAALTISSILSPTVPCNYDLIITNRGVVLHAYSVNKAFGSFGFVVIQRPVDKITGVVLTTKGAPVFVVCVVPATSVTGANLGVVREDIVTLPTVLSTATTATDRVLVPINLATAQVPVVDADGNYLIVPLNMFGGSRGVYTEELDLVMWAPAGPYLFNTPVTINMFGADRVYAASQATTGASTGCRFLFLSSGGGLP